MPASPVYINGSVDMQPNPLLLLRWHQMGEREQLVWAVTFAQRSSHGLRAALKADRAVERLRSLLVDESPVMEPEYQAARAGFSLDPDEFAAWYRVAFRLIHGRAFSYRDPTEAETQEAYERYRMSICDFY